MSVITYPDKEPSVTCGFYNGGGGLSRKYDATQMNSLFDGILRDGIFASIGTCFVVSAGSGNTVNVGTGKAWFNRTWTQNDGVLPVDCGDPEIVLDRIDAVMIVVDQRESVKDNFIRVVKGKPASSPVRPTKDADVDDPNVYYYPLCYIYRKAEATEITQADITNAVGVETPFVTGIMTTLDPKLLVKEWSAKLNDYLASEKVRVTDELNAFMEDKENGFNEWYSQMKTLMEDAINETNAWTSAQKKYVIDWFEEMKDILSENAATNLWMKVDDSEIKNILLNGFVDGVKTISADGKIIISINSSGQTLVKTFTDDFSSCTSVLYNEYGGELGRLTKHFSADGLSITLESTTVVSDELSTVIQASIEDSWESLY